MSETAKTQYPLYIDGPEQARLDPSLPDGGLPPAVGVQSWQVFRSSRDVPELSDGRPWSYRHHVDMACWKGRLYIGFNSCQKDEDVWPSVEQYITSEDGVHWSKPAELFPQGISTCLRMYFFIAPNGRMLAIAGLRLDADKTSEKRKVGLVVREILADHTLGNVFTLQCSAEAENRPRMFTESKDAGFVETCTSLLADSLFLEQQDYGRLLGPNRIKWHDAANWPGGIMPGAGKWIFGKAMCIVHRKDDMLAVTKMGWAMSSSDGGKTWTAPIAPPTFISGGAKAWVQQTSDGRYALVYNPARKNRFPLALVTSEDGIHFRDMRIVQGELPLQRYDGKDRSPGPQYTRGISEWSSDGSRNDNAMWLVYSMSKEDIWVSRVPLPVKADETAKVDDDLTTMAVGPLVRDWNTYCPAWTSVGVAETEGMRALQLEQRDPYDYARATRLFPECARVKVRFSVMASQADKGQLDIELMGKFGSPRPVRITLSPDGKVKAADCERISGIGTYEAGKWLDFAIEADATRGRYSVTLSGQKVIADALFAQPSESFQRISFRTGAYRGIGGTEHVCAGTDRPHEPYTYAVRYLRVE